MPKSTDSPTVFSAIAARGRDNADALRDGFSGPITEMAIDYLRVNPHNPRTRISERSIEEMANAVRQVGEVLQPILARPIARDPLGRTHEVVCGNRRLLGAERAGLRKVAVRVKELSDDDAVRFAVWENLAREDLDPMDQAESIDTLRKIDKLSWSDLAAQFGVSRQWVWQQQRLTSLPEAIKTHVRERRLNISVASALSTMVAVEDDAVALAAEIVESGLSRQNALALIRARSAPPDSQNVKPALHSWTRPAGYEGRAYSRLQRAVDDLLSFARDGKITPALAESLRPVLASVTDAESATAPDRVGDVAASS